MLGFLVLVLFIGDLLPELYTSAHDPPALDGDPVVFEVSAGQHLPGVGSERAEFLEVFLSGEAVIVSPAQPSHREVQVSFVVENHLHRFILA